MRRSFRIFKDERGTSAVEYALIGGMVFLALLVGVVAVGGSTMDMWNYVSEEVRKV